MLPKPSTYFYGLSSFEILVWFRRGLFYTYLSIYLRHYLGLSVTETTLFATLPMIVNILGQTLIWGRLSDRLQIRRSLIIIGELSAGAGTTAVWYAHRMCHDPVAAGYVIICGLAVIELFWSMSNIAWSALISDLYTESQRTRIQGRLLSLGGVGRMAGIWIGGLLYDGMGAHFNGWGFHHGALFFIATGAMWISAIPLLLLPEGGVSTLPAAESATDLTPDAIDQKNRFLIFLIAMAFINFGRNSIAVISPQYLTLSSGFAVDSRMLSYIINTQSAAMIIFGFLVGRISARFHDHNCLMAATALSVTALIMLASAASLPIIYTSSFLRGTADVIITATAYTLASALIPAARRGRLFSLFNATFFLSWGLAGTLLAGPIIDGLVKFGASAVLAYQSAIYAAAVLTMVGLFILWRFRQTKIS